MIFDFPTMGFRAVILTLLLLATGCASYETQKTPIAAQATGAEKEVVASNHLLEVRAVPMLEQEVAKPYLGIDPASTGLAPILFRIRNAGAGPVKIDLPLSYLSSRSDEKSPCLSIDEACRRALRSDAEVVGWTFGFGIVGGLASMSKVAEANRALESDYQKKQFKPTLINSGGSGEGVVFFDVPKEKQPHIRSVVIAYQDLGSNQAGEIVLNFAGPGTE
jgi:hypothetical protein